MSIFKGSGVAITTPFKGDKVDYEKLGELLEWHIDEGTDAIVICGTTGESATMSNEEQKEDYPIYSEKSKSKNSCDSWNWKQ